MPDTDIKSMTIEELTEIVVSYGEQPYRAGQLYKWIHQKLARDYDEMTDLSKKFRTDLRKQYPLTALKPVKRCVSGLDGTEKYLFELDDGNVIESVLMRYRFGNSVCISSQAGCRMGCRFCASTIGGLYRNLLPSEMLDQVYSISKITGERISHVVVMGTGEPLDNFDNLLRFIRILTDENGLNIGQRSVTVSTCGLTDKIRDLAEQKLTITLALSLHAPTQEKRMALMPIAYKYEIKDVVNACAYYFNQTGRRVTFEYSMIRGVNDSAQDAVLLADLLKGQNCLVNLIPVNPVRERNFRPSDSKTTDSFKNILQKNGISCTIRRSMGKDINGACGQLRRNYIKASAK